VIYAVEALATMGDCPPDAEAVWLDCLPDALPEPLRKSDDQEMAQTNGIIFSKLGDAIRSHDLHDVFKTMFLRQGRHREVRSEGSWRPRCEVRNMKGIEGSLPSPP
jgi:hypothetical protein